MALHKKTDFVTHFSKNVDAILPKCFKTLFSVLSFWYLVWGLSTSVVLIYLKDNTSKQVLHSLMHVQKWYWWCHQKPVVFSSISPFSMPSFQRVTEDLWDDLPLWQTCNIMWRKVATLIWVSLNGVLLFTCSNLFQNTKRHIFIYLFFCFL